MMKLLIEDFVTLSHLIIFISLLKYFGKKNILKYINIGSNTFKIAGSIPYSSKKFEDTYSLKLSKNDYDNISKLRQIFNRMPVVFMVI